MAFCEQPKLACSMSLSVLTLDCYHKARASLATTWRSGPASPEQVAGATGCV